MTFATTLGYFLVRALIFSLQLFHVVIVRGMLVAKGGDNITIGTSQCGKPMRNRRDHSNPSCVLCLLCAARPCSYSIVALLEGGRTSKAVRPSPVQSYAGGGIAGSSADISNSD